MVVFRFDRGDVPQRRYTSWRPDGDFDFAIGALRLQVSLQPGVRDLLGFVLSSSNAFEYPYTMSDVGWFLMSTVS
jgi:hypothetical protein